MWPSCTVLRPLRSLVHVVCWGPMGSAGPRDPGKYLPCSGVLTCEVVLTVCIPSFPVQCGEQEARGWTQGSLSALQVNRSQKGAKICSMSKRTPSGPERASELHGSWRQPDTHRSLPAASWRSYLSSGDRRMCCGKGTVGKV